MTSNETNRLVPQSLPESGWPRFFEPGEAIREAMKVAAERLHATKQSSPQVQRTWATRGACPAGEPLPYGRGSARSRRGLGWLLLLAAVWPAGAGCDILSGGLPWGVNPFVDLDPVALDGVARRMAYDVAPLGELDAGAVIRVEVTGQAVEAVLILAENPDSINSGLLTGGGPANAAFNYRVQASGRYYVFALFDPQTGEAQRLATLAVGFGDPAYRPPAEQVVRVIFEEGYLTEPGLVDPESFTDEERQVLADLSDLVRAEVLDRLRGLFAGTPIEILGEDDPLPNAPWSELHYLSERRLAGADEWFDAALPPLLPEHPECRDVVIFGEVLPHGAFVDPGNQVLDDQAAVYVGSFQGRGADCRSAAIDSVGSIVLGLSHTGAHEIGHLVGLFHVPLTDIMNRSPTLAFQRELSFERGQILVEDATQGQVLTTVIQDPEFYFQAIFDRP